MYKKLSEEEELLATQIVDIAYKIHKQMGPGLLESVYEKCFCYELEKRKINYERQKPISIYYDNIELQDGLRIDIMVNDLIIIELKAQQDFHPVWTAQLISYLKLADSRLGFLINFHVPLIKDGIKRIII
ncbi:MAG: hypothetical protein RL065_1895 [Bacteroidota bacterium]|jgi:GxxExxY protein